MSLLYKRLLTIILLIICIMAVFSLASCKDVPPEKECYVPNEGLCVNYINVGTGDCSFIRLPDDKYMLIDAGNSLQQNYQNVKDTLKAYNVERIDYFIITNPSKEHIDGALLVLEDFSVKVAYLPNIKNYVNYATYSKLKSKLSQMGVQTEFSMPLTNLSGSDYSIYFLSPCGSSSLQGYYGEFNSSLEPNSEAEKNLSPIIYLEYNDVRFLFSSDATTLQESLVLTNYQLGIYNNIFPNLNLKDIDFLKLGNHGGSESCSNEFVQLLNPKVGVISVGARDNSNLPNTALILRILEICPNLQMLRTDIDGSILVNVCKKNQYEIFRN